ncbi:hypothetical protein LCGC14_0593190 [marine sediment metagenome]|uniref:Uncharacterized protein n=1 Tax=marine sediment metagenome TaxID=412755 RepID=A0A0F9TZ06_9ZZZZ
MEQAKIRKQKAEKRILEILRSLEEDTDLEVTDIEFGKHSIAEISGAIAFYEMHIRLRMELG